MSQTWRYDEDRTYRGYQRAPGAPRSTSSSQSTALRNARVHW